MSKVFSMEILSFFVRSCFTKTCDGTKLVKFKIQLNVSVPNYHTSLRSGLSFRIIGSATFKM